MLSCFGVSASHKFSRAPPRVFPKQVVTTLGVVQFVVYFGIHTEKPLKLRTCFGELGLQMFSCHCPDRDARGDQLQIRLWVDSDLSLYTHYDSMRESVVISRQGKWSGNAN